MRKISILIVLSLFFMTTYGQSDHANANIHKVVAEEVIQATAYTYILANENGAKKWLATTKVAAKVGETYYYEGGFEMKDFTSKELNRTFESIYFLNSIKSANDLQQSPVTSAPPAAGSPTNQEKIAVAPGGISVAELFANKAKYAGTTVKIRGKVAKYNANIMGTNWIHLQDGTGTAGSNDITVTSEGTSKVGDVITIEGKVTLNKDFGAGYFYNVIVEGAKIVE